jgi:site-specific DNA recombinase
MKSTLLRKEKIYMMKKKAAIYARVSSQKQKDDCTIDSQVTALIAYAKEHEYSVLDNWVFLDEGVSGSILQRPALDMLRDLIRVEALEAVLIYSPDRLSRSYPHQLILMEEFRKHGVKICYLKAPEEAKTPEGKMFSHFQGIIAEYERALIIDRSRRGRFHKAKQGNPSVIPKMPYGYLRIKTGENSLVKIEESKAAIVRDIFRMFICEELSLQEIARKLTEKGIKTPLDNSRWHFGTIREMIKNTTYIGTAYYGKTEAYEGKSDLIRYHRSGKFIKAKYAKKSRPVGEWIPISVPPIISESDFELAQERLKKNKEFSSRNTKYPALLQGLVLCGICGLPFYKRAWKCKESISSDYCCRSKMDKKFKRCTNPSVPQKELDEAVYKEILNLIKDPSLIQQELTRRAKEVSNIEEVARQEVALKKEIYKISIERDRLLDAYQSGVVDLKDLRKRHQGIDERLKILEKDERAFQALRMEAKGGVDLKRSFEAILKRIEARAEHLGFEEKRKLIRLLVEKIIIEQGTVKIIHCVSPRVFAQENCQLQTIGVASSSSVHCLA